MAAIKHNLHALKRMKLTAPHIVELCRTHGGPVLDAITYYEATMKSLNFTADDVCGLMAKMNPGQGGVGRVLTAR